MQIQDVEITLGRTTAAMITQMSRQPETPQFVIDRVLRLKKLMDRVDGVMSAGIIAQVLLDSGFDPEGNQYPGQPVPEPVKAEELEKVDEEIVNVPSAKEPVVIPDEPEEEDEGPHNFLKDGTQVSFVADGEKKSGLIEKHQVDSEDVYYNIAVEGEADPYFIHSDDLTVNE
jgi:hypothetical protein